MPTVRIWSVLSILLSAVIVAAALRLGAAGELPPYEHPALQIAIWEGAALGLLGLIALLAARPLARLLRPVDGGPAAWTSRPFLTLFLISFVALFVELALIRYCSSQIRIFSFYKNVPLIGCFVGLGLGCFLGRGRSRHALWFLAWMVPLAVFLSAGSIVVRNVLGELAAIGSSEHILGDVAAGSESTPVRVLSQLVMAGFCVATFVTITLLFELLGRMLGDAFERVPRITGYTVNIVGSLAGILAFTGLCYLETPPPLWFAVGLLPLLWWIPQRRWAVAAVGLVAVNVLAVLPSYGETVWSRYQKLVGHPVRSADAVPTDAADAYLVQISDVFYQVAVDLRPEAVVEAGGNPYPHYDAVYAGIPTPERVLIVGAGTGNDVAAALRAGAGRVDAVDIDPAIVAMGRRAHPERPYDDSRVHVVVDDARHAFRVAEPQSYDLVVFGLLDSHTQLGTSSVRLDNYVFTMESLAAARRLVKPGGHIALTAAVFQPWLRQRFVTMLAATTGSAVATQRHKVWHTFLAPVGEVAPPPATASVALPRDDWPFVYLPAKGVPAAYIWVVVALILASIAVLKWRGLRFGSLSRYHGHMFFLGAAFLLMEVHAINRLALLFGTVWLVSAVTIAIVLLLIVCANLTVAAFGRVPYWLAYSALGLSLGASFWIEPAAVLGGGAGAALLVTVVLLSPVYFAGLVFARSFAIARVAAPAFGANILGAVLGGWSEYGTMAIGVRNLVLLAAGFYLASLVLLVLGRRRPDWPDGAETDQAIGEPGAIEVSEPPREMLPEPEGVGAR